MSVEGPPERDEAHDYSGMQTMFPIGIALGAVIRTHREARHWTQKHLALEADLHPMSLSKIERGVHQDVGVATLARLATALKGQKASDLVALAEQWQMKVFDMWKLEGLPLHLLDPDALHHLFHRLLGQALGVTVAAHVMCSERSADPTTTDPKGTDTP